MDNPKSPEHLVIDMGIPKSSVDDMENLNLSEPVDSPIKTPKPTRSCWELFCILVIPIVYPSLFVYDVLYVIPQLLGPIGVTVNAVACSYISYNILGNLWACCRKTSEVDTLPPELLTPAKGEEHLWHYCEECQRLMPPRAWHCNRCKCCILKRDHHCTFTGNCIGHTNQRYFIWMTFYLSLGSGLVIIYNGIFAYKHGFFIGDLFKFYTIFIQEPKFLFRYAISVTFNVNLFCFLFPIYMFATEVSMVRKNTVMLDKSNYTYDLGVRRNFVQVLGHLSFWTCLSPAIKSPLPHVGTQWQSKASD